MSIQKKTLMRTGKKATVASQKSAGVDTKATMKRLVAPKRDFVIQKSKIKISY